MAGVKLAPVGRPVALSVTLLAGTSLGSVAVTVNVNKVSSSSILLPIVASTGRSFTGLTVILTTAVSNPPWPSETVYSKLASP